MTAKVFRIDGKVALVAGESPFWSKAIAVALAKAGAEVAIAAKSSPKLTAAVEAASKAGKKAIAIPTDVTVPAQVQKAVQQTVSEFGKIDILVNASDIMLFEPFLEIKDADWQKAMDYNLTSAMHFCKAAGKQMLAQKKGRIINVVSGLAERGMVNGAAYCVSMGGVLQLTRVLGLEWATQGVTVNAIGTGWFTEEGEPRDVNLTKYIPAKRYGKASDIGGLVVYLASDATEFTTGQFIFVDGGLMAHA